jgi:hypothetical protein
MKHLLIALCLAAPFNILAQSSQSNTQTEQSPFTPEFQEWWASDGWMIQLDVKSTDNMLDISMITSTSGDGFLTAQIVMSENFDPRNYMIVLPPDAPLVYTIGDSGKVLYFHSANRALVLHNRYEINKQAQSKL